MLTSFNLTELENEVKIRYENAENKDKYMYIYSIFTDKENWNKFALAANSYNKVYCFPINDEDQYTKPLEIVLNQLLKFSDDYTTADEFDLKKKILFSASVEVKFP